jgi:hypothetical protein
MQKYVASMHNLRLGLRIFGWLLHMYPKAYYRKYSAQILQTTDDALQAEASNKTARARIWLRTWLDLIISIPTEHIRSLKPRRFIISSCIISVLLALPLLASLVIALLQSGRVISGYSIVSDNLALFDRIWMSRQAFIVWGIVLPALAALSAGLGLFAWYLHRVQHPRAKKRYVARTIVVSMSLAGLLSIAILSIAAYGWMKSRNQLAQDISASRLYQAEHPTLACKLLPESAAQSILGKGSYINNPDPRGGRSGIVEDSPDIENTACTYFGGKDGFGILTTVQYGKNTAAVSNMKHLFDAGTVQSSAISLAGHNGYYMDFGRGSFSLSFWVNDHWITVTAANFENASRAMSVMTQNLNIEQRQAENNAPEQIPPTPDELSSLDRTTIANAVQNQNTTIPAGTSLDIKILSVANNTVSGSFQYSNGTAGTYSAAKKHGGWWDIIQYAQE